MQSAAKSGPSLHSPLSPRLVPDSAQGSAPGPCLVHNRSVTNYGNNSREFQAL